MIDEKSVITVVGAGLAGCEAAWQAAKRGIRVRLLEMRPLRMTEAHKTAFFAELVCSNSFRGAALTNGVGLLKEELRVLGSLILESADLTRVPAGGALAVDRERFSALIEERIRSHPLITCAVEEVTEVPPHSPQAPAVIATGPLTSTSLAKSIEKLLGSEQLAFFDAISPILLDGSIDHEIVFAASRYGKGDGNEYLNVPLSKEQYEQFVSDILAAETHLPRHEADNGNSETLKPFEGCMPIEDMAARGIDVLRHGPLKPVGLRDPRTGKRPHAVLQLRAENMQRTMWNLVGMQTRMKHSEQAKVFRRLPGLAGAEFVRMGSVHRNTFIQSPKCLLPTLQSRHSDSLFFAGQMTGVEGYVESTAAGLAAGLNAARVASGRSPVTFPPETAMGSLLKYITEPSRVDFQPMNISFGLIDAYAPTLRSKGVSKDSLRHQVAEASLATLRYCEF